MNNSIRIAGLMTCHDRREKSMACLKSVFAIRPDVDIFLVDDGCKDGTAEAVKESFPLVHIIQGNGNLYWSRGMYTAWKEALKGDYDFYLWLNDDIELYPNAIDEMLACFRILNEKVIITGIVENKEKTKCIYGGHRDEGGHIQADGVPHSTRNMNGNVVLVHRSIVKEIGIMDGRLHHDIGDVDYGMTANEHGIDVYTTRIPIAMGYENPLRRYRKWNTSLKKRIEYMNSPIGGEPATLFYFYKKHYGVVRGFLKTSLFVIRNISPDWFAKYLYK